MLYYVYILYSASSDKYYVGSTQDYQKRLLQHNSSENNTFTSKHIPWTLVCVFRTGDTRSSAIQIERFIKRQKSKRFIESIIDHETELVGPLSTLIRVDF